MKSGEERGAVLDLDVRDLLDSMVGAASEGEEEAVIATTPPELEDFLVQYCKEYPQAKGCYLRLAMILARLPIAHLKTATVQSGEDRAATLLWLWISE